MKLLEIVLPKIGVTISVADLMVSLYDHIEDIDKELVYREETGNGSKAAFMLLLDQLAIHSPMEWLKHMLNVRYLLPSNYD